jgi:hypothetical protein
MPVACYGKKMWVLEIGNAVVFTRCNADELAQDEGKLCAKKHRYRNAKK